MAKYGASQLNSGVRGLQGREDAHVTNIAERLSGGDLRSIGDANVVALQLLQDQALVAQAVDLIAGRSPLLRARAADALEKAARRSPVILQPHTKRLVSLMATARQQEVRWHIAQMVPRLELSASARRRALRKLRSYLDDDSRIVQVCALQALWDLATPEERSRGSIRTIVERLAVESSPAVRARARRLLGEGRRRRTGS